MGTNAGKGHIFLFMPLYLSGPPYVIYTLFVGRFGSFGIMFCLGWALSMACTYVVLMSLNFLKLTSPCPLVFRKFQVCPL